MLYVSPNEDSRDQRGTKAGDVPLVWMCYVMQTSGELSIIQTVTKNTLPAPVWLEPSQISIV